VNLPRRRSSVRQAARIDPPAEEDHFIAVACPVLQFHRKVCNRRFRQPFVIGVLHFDRIAVSARLKHQLTGFGDALIQIGRDAI